MVPIHRGEGQRERERGKQYRIGQYRKGKDSKVGKKTKSVKREWQELLKNMSRR